MDPCCSMCLPLQSYNQLQLTRHLELEGVTKLKTDVGILQTSTISRNMLLVPWHRCWAAQLSPCCAATHHTTIWRTGDKHSMAQFETNTQDTSRPNNALATQPQLHHSPDRHKHHQSLLRARAAHAAQLRQEAPRLQHRSTAQQHIPATPLAQLVHRTHLAPCNAPNNKHDQPPAAAGTTATGSSSSSAST